MEIISLRPALLMRVTITAHFCPGVASVRAAWSGAPAIAAMDLFIVPAINFDLLYALVIIRLDRRDLVWVNVTTNPTAEWIAR
jgi:hypothetical protein